MIVPYPPGGGSDLVGRMVAQKLSEALGQQVVVDNRGGATGSIGAELVAKSPPDGYTIPCNSSAFAVNVSLFSKPGYDPTKFAPVINGGVIPQCA